MKQSRNLLIALIILSIAACTPKQDLVQKAFDGKNFGHKLEGIKQEEPNLKPDKIEKDETKVEVLVDNIQTEKDEPAVFNETGGTQRPDKNPFKNDPDAPGLKFDEIELYEVVRVLLEQLGVNYIIDPSLKDQAITLDIKESDTSFKVSDLLDLVLKLHDLTMVVHERYVHIVPIDAPEVTPRLKLLHGSRPNKNLRKEELAIQIVPLKYVAPADISSVIKEFLSPSHRILEEPKNNVLIIIDKYQYIAKAMELLPVFDVNILANKKMVFYELAHVDSSDVASKLEEILSVYGYDSESERLKIMPIDTLNGILVVSSSTAIFKELDYWIDKFDKEAQLEDETVFVYQVENTTSDSIAYTLSQIYGIRTLGGGGGGGFGSINRNASNRRSTSPGGGGGSGGRFGNNRNNNNNDRNNRNNQNNQNNQNNRNNNNGLNSNNNRNGNNQNQNDRFNQNNRFGGRGGAVNNQNLDEDAPTMVIDEDNNSLIFLTTPREYSRILKTLKKLDVLPRQVFLEVTVLSVELRDTFQFGIDWSGNNETKEPNSSNSFVAGFPAIDGSGGEVASPFGGSYSYVGPTGAIAATVTAAKDKGYTNVLQQPHIMAIDNRSASITVGTDIPIQTTTTNISTIADGTGNRPASSSTIQYRPTGVTLNFTPHINANGVIRLEINLDISQAGQQVGSEAVPITQNALDTEMIVRDNQTAIMGGLIFNQEGWSRSTVPLLGRIPILKHLISDRKSDSTKTELVIMITPRLIDSEEKSIEISKEFKDKILKEFEGFKHNRN